MHGAEEAASDVHMQVTVWYKIVGKWRIWTNPDPGQCGSRHDVPMYHFCHHSVGGTELPILNVDIDSLLIYSESTSMITTTALY